MARPVARQRRHGENKTISYWASQRNSAAAGGFLRSDLGQVSFPELSHDASSQLRKFGKEAKSPEWRSSAGALAEKLRDSAQTVADARARADFGPHGAAGVRGMLEPVPGLDAKDARRTPVQRFYDVEAARVAREERIRDEEALQKKPNEAGLDLEGASELESGCSDSEGSEMSMSESDGGSDSRSEEAAVLKSTNQKKSRKNVAGGKRKEVLQTLAGFRVGANGRPASDDEDRDDEVGALELSSDED